MKKRNSWFVENAFFHQALAYGRGYSLLMGHNEIKANSMLAGISWAMDAMPAVIPPDVMIHRHKFRKARERMAVILSADPSPIVGKTPRLTPVIQSRLSRTKISCEEFLELLFTLEEDILASRIHKKIVTTASIYARHYGHTDISREVYAVAAYRIYLDGGMSEKPSLSNYMALNRECFRFYDSQMQPWPSGSDDSFNVAIDLEFDLAILIIDFEGGSKNTLITALNFSIRRAAAHLLRRPIAIHEAGHAIALFSLMPYVPIFRASIHDPFSTSGFVEFSTDHPASCLDWSKNWHTRQIAVFLAGRAAEILAYGPMRTSAGAASDIEKATFTAYSMVAAWGHDTEFAPVCLEVIRDRLGAPTGWIFDEAQKRIYQLLRDSHELAVRALKENWILVLRLADELVDREILEADELMGILVESGLKEISGSELVIKKPEVRKVIFAISPGDCQTREGPVRYAPGDALVEGAIGEIWPVSRAQFQSTYEVADGQTYWESGLYKTIAQERYALKVGFDRQVQLTRTRGTLFAKEGDWLVDYGQGDIAVVSGELFEQYYEAAPRNTADIAT